MSTVLKRITTRAKQLYKKGRAGISWVAAIKRASAQIKTSFKEGYQDRAAKYRPHKKKAKRKTAKRSRRKVGAIVSNPKLLAANVVGKGPTIKPTRHYVNVATVSGVKKRKMAGMEPGKEDLLRRIKFEMQALDHANGKLWDLKDMDKRGMNRALKAEHKRHVAFWNKKRIIHRQHIIDLKKLL